MSGLLCQASNFNDRAKRQRRRVTHPVTSLEFCSVWNYLEVKEGRDDNTFTCTGLTDHQEVSWVFDNLVVKKCPPVPPSCTALPYGYFNISRTSNENFDITIMATQISDLSILPKNLTCSTNTEAKLCQMDIIYPAENSTCNIEFSGETWTVTGWCSVPKLKSTKFLDKSGCYFHPTSQTAGTAAAVGFYKMNLQPSAQTGYYTGTCNMTSYLPNEGQYSYTVIIMPGQVNVSPTFTGSNEIRRPSGSLIHNCPQNVTQGADLICRCSVSDLGSPQGRLQWNITDSSQLSLTGLQREQHGDNYVCSLTWNRTVQQSLTYTLIITYKPSKMSFKLNNNANSTVTVAENTTVTMVCQSDGRPAPSLTITDVTNGNRDLQSVSGGNVTGADNRELSHTITAVQCEASGEYRCAANKGEDKMNQSLNLFVKCKPRRVPSQSNSSVPIVFEGKSESFELIVYPTSVNLTKYHLGPNITSDEGPANNDTFSAECRSIAGVVYKITCTVTVNRVTPDTADYYKVSVSNGLGEVELIFQAKPRDTATATASPINSSDRSPAGIIAGAVVGGILVIGLVTIAVILLLRRRGRKNSNKPASKTEAKFNKEDKDEVLTTNAIYDSSDNQPLASKQTVRPSDCGAVLSMSPVAESAYENAAFSGETANKGKKKGNGAKEAKRRNEQGLLYTTVVFSNAPTSQKSAPPQPEPTEYATIRQASAQQ